MVVVVVEFINIIAQNNARFHRARPKHKIKIKWIADVR